MANTDGEKVMVWKKNKEMLSGNGLFLLGLFLFAIANVCVYFGHGISDNNATVFAFSYQYGFISRGFLGTCYQILDRILPWDLYTHGNAYLFSIISTAGYYVVLFVFFAVLLKDMDEDSRKYQQCLIFFLSIFVFSMYLRIENFGRLDIYLIILSLFCIICIIKERMLWLIPLLCAVCTCLHHGFIFMNANAIVVLLFYRIFQKKRKDRKKYIMILIASCLVTGVLFFYFEFLSHGQGEEIYNSVASLSMKLSETGMTYNENLLKHEILGQGVFADEWDLHLLNYKEFPFFLVFFLPYLILGINFFRSLVRNGMLVDKVRYGAVFFGAFSVLPEMILKVDYGRYVFQVVFYYLVVLMALIAMGDDKIMHQLKQLKALVYSKTDVPMLLLIYPMAFMPLYDVVISYVVDDVAMLFWG